MSVFAMLLSLFMSYFERVLYLPYWLFFLGY